MPVPEKLSDHYGVQPDRYWSAQSLELDVSYFSDQISTYKRIANGDGIGKPTALDIGAGTGKCMLALGNAGFEAWGIEPEDNFYKFAASRGGISSRLQNATLEKSSFPADFFDFITFGAVLEHLYDPNQAIAIALRYLKPNGLIHIEVPSSKWLINKMANFIYRIQGLDYCANISPMHSPFHIYEFDLESFKHNAIRNGYDIAFHKYIVGSTYLPSFVDPIMKPLMRHTNMGMQLEIWLRKKAAIA